MINFGISFISDTRRKNVYKYGYLAINFLAECLHHKNKYDLKWL